MQKEIFQTDVTPVYTQVRAEDGCYDIVSGYTVLCKAMSECGEKTETYSHFHEFSTRDEAKCFAGNVEEAGVINLPLWTLEKSESKWDVPYWGTLEFACRERNGTL